MNFYFGLIFSHCTCDGQTTHNPIHIVSFIHDLWHMLFLFLYTGKITTSGQSQRKCQHSECRGKKHLKNNNKKKQKTAKRSIKDLEYSVGKLATISNGNVASVCHCQGYMLASLKGNSSAFKGLTFREKSISQATFKKKSFLEKASSFKSQIVSHSKPAIKDRLVCRQILPSFLSTRGVGELSTLSLVMLLLTTHV